jgi:hypothetical protein
VAFTSISFWFPITAFPEIRELDNNDGSGGAGAARPVRMAPPRALVLERKDRRLVSGIRFPEKTTFWFKLRFVPATLKK